MNTIHFHNADCILNIKNKKTLKRFLPILFTEANKSLDCINYIFCSDAYLLNINKEFLQHDYLTDILTFDLSNDKISIIGEIYISIDRVKDNASIFGKSFNEEMHRVIFHGALHLCGYKDKKINDIKTMRRAEDFYLAKYFN
jgi:rRNA maturation RNase YbeY